MKIILNTEHIQALQHVGSITVGVVFRPQLRGTDPLQEAPIRQGAILRVAESWSSDGNTGFLYRADACNKNIKVVWQSASRMPQRAIRMSVKVTDLQTMQYSYCFDKGPFYLFSTSKASRAGMNQVLVPSKAQVRLGKDPLVYLVRLKLEDHH